MLKIRINDYRNYNAETCHNGGNYAFFTTYREMPDGRFRIEYDTTADFPYCPCCGNFYDYARGCWCGDRWQYTTWEEAYKAYEEANADPDEELYAEIETF